MGSSGAPGLCPPHIAHVVHMVFEKPRLLFGASCPRGMPGPQALVSLVRMWPGHQGMNIHG